MTSCATLVVFSGSLVGNVLAPNEKLSTLPVALFIIGTATNTVPVALLMQKFGRKLIFQSVAAIGIFFAGIATISIIEHSFIFFCITIFLLGTTIAAVQQFRFAAMESVSADLIPKAASQVLLGGIISAILGPEIAVFGKDMFEQDYAGSFTLLAGLYFIAFLFLTQFINTIPKKEEVNTIHRSLKTIATQPVFWVAVLGGVVGYSVMSFVMTATPVSMHIMDGHSLEETKWVIQSHIMSMFLPSLFTAWIIRKIGITKMMVLGIIAFSICIAWAYSGHAFIDYWVALMLLGIGWNFLFIGGTTLLPQSYEPSERFKVQAFNEFLVFGIQAIASISAGWILFQLGWNNLLLITIPLLIVQIVTIAIWKYSLRSSTEQ